MDKMEKCRPDDSIIWATRSWQKTCSPRVLKEGERKAAGGGGWGLPKGVVPVLVSSSSQRANTERAKTDQERRGHEAGRDNSHDEIKIEELANIR